MKNEDRFDTLQCWTCHGERQRKRCPKCSGTGRLFWVGGYAYPYTPEGEKRAKEAERANNRR